MARKLRIQEEDRTVSASGMNSVSSTQTDSIFLERLKRLDSTPENNSSYNLQYIPLEKLVVNPKNEFYRRLTTEEDVRSLADMIAVSELKSPIEVRPLSDGTYRIIGGETRFRALKLLKEEGTDKYPKGVPCLVGPENMSETEELLRLHITNIPNRTFSDKDRIEQVMQFQDVLKEVSKEEGFKLKKATLTSLIAHYTKLSERKVHRYQTHIGKLIPELLEKYMDGMFGQREADMLIQLNEEDQRKLLALVNQGVKPTIHEIQAIKMNNQDEVKPADPEKDDSSEQKDKVIPSTTENSNVSIVEVKDENTLDGIDEKQREAEKEIAASIMNQRYGEVSSLDIQNIKMTGRLVELRKLFKTVNKSISVFIEKEKEYLKEFGVHSELYDSFNQLLSEVSTGGEG